MKKTRTNRFLEKIIPEPNSGCWLWDAGCTKKGYGSFRTGIKKQSAHRFSYELFRGDIPEDLHVLHKCDTRCCVNPDHLFLGTNLDNVRDMYRKGRNRLLLGDLNGATKLDRNQVLEVRDLRKKGLSERKIAEKFNVSRGSVNAILSGRTWKHVS